MRLHAAIVLVLAGLVPVRGWAQSTTTGSIAGTVKDTTGAVLPGVTVDAASPALIEKTRSAVTDAEGNYNVLDLRPGTYTVTFTLPGFTTVRRERLALTTAFTANVSVEMRVGAVEETVTVTGASPVVDVRNVRTQQVLSRELWDALPPGKNLQSYVSLTLGATMRGGQDVGGSLGEQSRLQTSFTYRGAGRNDSAIFVDGMAFTEQRNGGGPWTRRTHHNQLAYEETTIGSGVSAEQESAGIVINLVPRDGGNAFTGTFALDGSYTRLQSDNLTRELVARGVATQGKVTKLYDVGGGVGGPIKRDRVWLFASDRWWNAKNIIPGAFFNATPEPAFGLIPIYTPDMSRPAETGNPHHNDNLRLTWQMTSAQKLSFSAELQSACACYRGGGSGTAISLSRAPEAGLHIRAPYGSTHVYQASWNYVKASRWLFSIGNSSYLSKGGGTARVEESSPTAIPLHDVTTGFFWNAPGDFPARCCSPLPDGKIDEFSYSHDQRYSATYSTGSHTFKVGARTHEHGILPGTASINATPFGPMQLQVRGGTLGVPPVPVGVNDVISPQGPASASENRGGNRNLLIAVYAQEDWHAPSIPNGFPPSYLLTGTRDMCLSQTALLHRKLRDAGIEADLNVFEGGWHGFQIEPDLPEAKSALTDFGRFPDRHMAS